MVQGKTVTRVPWPGNVRMAPHLKERKKKKCICLVENLVLHPYSKGCYYPRKIQALLHVTKELCFPHEKTSWQSPRPGSTQPLSQPHQKPCLPEVPSVMLGPLCKNAFLWTPKTTSPRVCWLRHHLPDQQKAGTAPCSCLHPVGGGAGIPLPSRGAATLQNAWRPCPAPCPEDDKRSLPHP